MANLLRAFSWMLLLPVEYFEGNFWMNLNYVQVFMVTPSQNQVSRKATNRCVQFFGKLFSCLIQLPHSAASHWMPGYGTTVDESPKCAILDSSRWLLSGEWIFDDPYCYQLLYVATVVINDLGEILKVFWKHNPKDSRWSTFAAPRDESWSRAVLSTHLPPQPCAPGYMVWSCLIMLDPYRIDLDCKNKKSSAVCLICLNRNSMKLA